MGTTQTSAIGYVPYTKTEVDNLLSPKAPLSSPALTDVPTAPTAAPGTDTTQLATTAFVGAAVGALTKVLPFTMQTDDFNAAVDNCYGMNKTGSIQVATLPATAAVGKVIQFRGYSADLFKVVANTGQTIKVANLTTKTAGYVQTDIANGGFDLTCMATDTVWEASNIIGLPTVETS